MARGYGYHRIRPARAVKPKAKSRPKIKKKSRKSK